MPSQQGQLRDQQRDERKGERIDAILEAAAEVFFEHGLAGARVDEIARRAGVNKAMLYYHVGDKQALFTTVLLRNIDRALAEVEAAAERPGSPEERLQAVVSALAEVSRRSDHLSLVLREITSGGANLGDEVLRRIACIAAVTLRIVSEGQQAGSFRQVDPLLVHLMMVACITFLTVSRPIRDRIAAFSVLPIAIPTTPEGLAAAVADVLLNGICPTPKCSHE